MNRLIIEDNSIYEIDEECLKRYEKIVKNKNSQNHNNKSKGDNNKTVKKESKK